MRKLLGVRSIPRGARLYLDEVGVPGIFGDAEIIVALFLRPLSAVTVFGGLDWRGCLPFSLNVRRRVLLRCGISSSMRALRRFDCNLRYFDERTKRPDMTRKIVSSERWERVGTSRHENGHKGSWNRKLVESWSSEAAPAPRPPFGLAKRGAAEPGAFYPPRTATDADIGVQPRPHSNSEILQNVRKSPLFPIPDTSIIFETGLHV